MKEESSDAEFYKLSEIPFEPTGAATDKYSYVAPKKFSIIEEKIDETARERKLYFVLLRAPQGGGKTATAVELKRRIEAKKYAAGKGVLILNRLIDLDFSNYAVDFMKQAMPLLPDFKWDKYDGKTSPGELRNAVAAVLKSLGGRYRLVAWVIDEFDVLVDYPKEKQSQFLQILREIIDELSNEKLPILFIMSHTVKSAKEFEKHLKEIHGPLQSRIVATFDIGYSYSEARAIVAARLRSVRRNDRPFNSIEPFAEDALKELYNLVLVTSGTGELNDFRLFERCCYFSILNGAKRKRKSIEKDDVKEEFQHQYKSWAKSDIGEKLSLALRTERSSILSGPPLIRNDAVLKGFIRGFKLMKDQFSDITGIKTRYEKKIGSGIHLSSLEFTVAHKPTGKKVSSVWLLATKEEGEMILQDDLKAILPEIPKALEQISTHINLSILSCVSDLDLDVSQITNFDRVIKVSSDAMRDLIGLGIQSATDDDVDVLRKSFDSDVAPLLARVFDESTRDITKDVTASVIRLAKTLNLCNAAGLRLTKEALKEEEKKLFGSGTRVADKHVSDLIALGFAKEEGTEIVSARPKALDHLDEMLHRQSSLKVEDILNEFVPNGESVLASAKALGLVSIDENQIVRRQPDMKKEVKAQVEIITPLLTKDTKSTFDGEKALQILKGVEKAQSLDDIPATIVASLALEFLPTIEKNIKQHSQQVSYVVERSPVKSGETKAPVRETRRTITQTPREVVKLEEAILSAIEVKGQLTLEELKKELALRGVSTDITSQVFGMVVHGKLKLAS
jgi:hypothetical protein